MSAQAFWDKAANLIAFTEKHPFLVAQVDGTLDLDKFRYYVVQDALYLCDFADCLTRLASHAGVQKQDVDRLKAFAMEAQHAEMMLHRGFFKEWNISAEGVQQMPYTLLYTSYMKRIVATKRYPEGLAVLLPCFWIYMHVGKCMLKLREQLGTSVQRPACYDAWIDMYGGEDFETHVNEYIAMVDAACKIADESTLKEMETHFIMSCMLEHMFWDQALTKMEWPKIS